MYWPNCSHIGVGCGMGPLSGGVTETTPHHDDGARRAADTAASRPRHPGSHFESLDINASPNRFSPGNYASKLWLADPKHLERLCGRVNHVFSRRCHGFADGASLLTCLRGAAASATAGGPGWYLSVNVALPVGSRSARTQGTRPTDRAQTRAWHQSNQPLHGLKPQDLRTSTCSAATAIDCGGLRSTAPPVDLDRSPHLNVTTFQRDLRASFADVAGRFDQNPPAQRLLIAGAALAAVCMMFAYVQACQESVERGDRWRAEQRALAGHAVVAAHQQGRP